MLFSIAHEIILAWGWKRRLIAFLSGSIGVLSLAPFGFMPAMLVSLTVAIWLIDGSVVQNPNRDYSQKPILNLAMLIDAAGIGWWFGFGYFVAGIWWLGSAFLVDAAEFAWAMPFGILGLPAVLAIFHAFGFMTARILWSSSSYRIFALAAGLGLSEWCRGHFFTGFPWNTYGMALIENIHSAQSASLFGLYGLTLLTIVIFSSPATLIDRKTIRSNLALREEIKISSVVTSAAALICIFAFGYFKLAYVKADLDERIKLRIIQPNLKLDASFSYENKETIVKKYLDLSDRATSPTTTGINDTTHLIWPESAFPFILTQEPKIIQQISDALGDKAILITGAARQELPASSKERRRFFNSIQIVSKLGLAEPYYDKIHLVPFGEYLPLAGLFEKFGLRQFVHTPGGFEAGSGPRHLSVSGLPLIEPLICYESIFPNEFDFRGPRAGVIVNLSNDGWFGETIGPHQHLAHARLKAIEEGLPIIRAANSGISAIIDPYGRVLKSLPLGAEGVLDGFLPRPTQATFYSEYRFKIPLLLWIVVCTLSMIGLRKKNQ